MVAAGSAGLRGGNFASSMANISYFAGRDWRSGSTPRADRVGGARVTLANFVIMVGAAGGALVFLDHRRADGAFAGFLAMFLILFVATGVGNGSTFRMIPAIFRQERLRVASHLGRTALVRADREARTEAATVLAFSSAIDAARASGRPGGPA